MCDDKAATGEILKRPVHREMNITCIQKLKLKTSHQDFCNIVMSQKAVAYLSHAPRPTHLEVGVLVLRAYV